MASQADNSFSPLDKLISFQNNVLFVCPCLGSSSFICKLLWVHTILVTNSKWFYQKFCFPRPCHETWPTMRFKQNDSSRQPCRWIALKTFSLLVLVWWDRVGLAFGCLVRFTFLRFVPGIAQSCATTGKFSSITLQDVSQKQLDKALVRIESSLAAMKKQKRSNLICSFLILFIISPFFSWNRWSQSCCSSSNFVHWNKTSIHRQLASDWSHSRNTRC